MGANSNMQTWFAYETSRSLRQIQRAHQRELRAHDRHMVDQWLAQHPPAHRRARGTVWAWVWEKFTR